MSATIRDQYVMAALVGLGSVAGGHALTVEGATLLAFRLAEVAAAEACKRWGHLGGGWGVGGSCARCGEAMPQESPKAAPKVRIPGHPIGCSCCTDGGLR